MTNNRKRLTDNRKKNTKKYQITYNKEQKKLVTEAKSK